MTEVAQTYLGNIHENTELRERLAREICWDICLSSSDRVKGRIHAHTDAGVAVGIVRNRDRILQSGDVFQTESQQLILIHLRESELLILDFSQVDRGVTPAQLVYVGHVLGNHHYPITIQEPDKIFVQLTSERAIIDKLIKDIRVPGLQIEYDLNRGSMYP